jgi:hypothetical protein
MSGVRKATHSISIPSSVDMIVRITNDSRLKTWSRTSSFMLVTSPLCALQPSSRWFKTAKYSTFEGGIKRTVGCNSKSERANRRRLPRCRSSPRLSRYPLFQQEQVSRGHRLSLRAHIGTLRTALLFRSWYLVADYRVRVSAA